MLFLILTFLYALCAQITALGNSVSVFNSDIGSNNDPDIIALDTNRYIVVFDSSHLNGTRDVYFQVMDGSTDTPTKVGGLYRVNVNVGFSEDDAHIAACGRDRFVVVTEASTNNNDGVSLNLYDASGPAVVELDELFINSNTDDYEDPNIAYLGRDYLALTFEFDEGIGTRLFSLAGDQITAVGGLEFIPRPAALARDYYPYDSYVTDSFASKLSFNDGRFAVTYGVTQNGNATVDARSSLFGQVYMPSAAGLTAVGDAFNLVLSEQTDNGCCAETRFNVVAGLGGSLAGHFITVSQAEDVTNNFAVIYLQLWNAKPASGPVAVGDKMMIQIGTNYLNSPDVVAFGKLPHALVVFEDEDSGDLEAQLLDLSPADGITLNGNRFAFGDSGINGNEPRGAVLLCDRVAVAWEDYDTSDRIQTRLLQIDPLVGVSRDCQSIDQGTASASSAAAMEAVF